MTLEWYEIIVILTDSRYQKKNEGSICQVKVKKKLCMSVCARVFVHACGIQMSLSLQVFFDSGSLNLELIDLARLAGVIS